MVPRAKKTLHECAYHLKNMSTSKNLEEFEICFAAFVNSSRNVTFVLQKEFNHNAKFRSWYKTKEEEMRKDPLCKFFHDLRNKIVKEGINDLQTSLTINSFNTSNDILDKPENNPDMIINNKGVYWHVHKSTGKEDYIPATTKGSMTTVVTINNFPPEHLGQDISNLNLLRISQIYYDYLRNLVEELTAEINISTPEAS